MLPDSNIGAKIEAVSFFEVTLENGKKNIGSKRTLVENELSEDEINLVEKNVSDLWNSEEKHDLNSSRNPPAIFIRQQKVARRGTSEILSFDGSEGSEIRKKVLNTLISGVAKDKFHGEAEKLCEFFKDTSYAPQVLITVAKIDIKGKKYISFFTHSMAGGWIMDKERIRLVKKALHNRFQKAFVFPYLVPSDETRSEDRVKYKDTNQKKADYMTKFLCLNKLYDPNDDFTVLTKDKSLNLEAVHKAINKKGKYAPHTKVIIRDGGTAIYTNLETLKNRIDMERDGSEKIVKVRLRSPTLFDHKGKKINHLVGWNDG